MFKISLPANGPKPGYYDAYVGYLRKILDYQGIEYSLEGRAIYNSFIMKIDGKDIVFDFSDYHKFQRDPSQYQTYFKFHYNKQKHGSFKNVYSFTPISFYTWDEFYRIQDEINYTCNNSIVFNMQEPRHNAFERRTFVQDMLKQRYKNNVVLTHNQSQEIYWKTINNCLVHVFVPGARNDMLDRGQLQCMAFGCCTISPHISDSVACDGDLIPDRHYIACDRDYSDLIEKIEWCKHNRKFCVEIGQNAKRLFNETSTPDKLWDWIVRNENVC